jgi:Uncharacterised nucleotidyltransferase
MTNEACMALVRHCLDLHGGEVAVLPELDKAEVASLQDEKLLPMYLALRGVGLESDEGLPLAVAIAKVEAHRAIEREATALCKGPCKAIKGDRIAAAYPSNLFRESRDLDLMVRDEPDFIQLCEHFEAQGYEPCFNWLFGTPRGTAASAKYRRDLPVQSRIESVYVEVHMKSFPVTPYSNFFVFDELAKRPENQQDLAYLIAEFIYRDGRTKRFTGRDVLDASLLLAAVPREQWEEFAAFIEDEMLAPGVLLLVDHWRARVPWPMPETLDWLGHHLKAQRWTGPYHILEHQSWPACRKRGMDRATFDFILETSETLYQGGSGVVALTDTELFYWLGTGLPVPCRLAKASSSKVLEAFEPLRKVTE